MGQKVNRGRLLLRIARVAALLVLLLPMMDGAAWCAAPPDTARLKFPHLEQGPKLEDFLSMAPSAAFAGKMAKVENFTQRTPNDGAPVSQKTELYVGYTDKNLYAVFVCFDSEPGKIRARLSRRENIGEDDQVSLILDTFNDQRRSYVFASNPLGVQQDAIFTDNNFDTSFDTLWNSAGKLTPQGYVVWFEIPFKSLRFPEKPEVAWGVFFERDIPRNNENSFWPRITSKIQNYLPQEAQSSGLTNISPGRNLQFIPYGVFHSFRTLDDRDPAHPFFTGAHARPRVGLDAKMVIKDSFVLDVTANPDFSQVESDEPQTTVNKRFEVFFPEKRPFFLENSNYFDTPYSLVFTRRIAAPTGGIRLTGKKGPWSIGYFGIDDKSPGIISPRTDPMAGKRAYFNILRVNHEFSKDLSLGMIFTDRELPCHNCSASALSGENDFNRVGGLDYKWRINKNWSMNGQAVSSNTKNLDGSRTWGNAYQQYVEYTTRTVEFNSWWTDQGATFRDRPGFFIRPDYRRFSNFFQYRFFTKEGRKLVQHGPSFFQKNTWDHTGTALEAQYNSNYRFQFKGYTTVGVFGNYATETLRPVDFSSLPRNNTFDTGVRGFFFHTQALKQVTLDGELGWGTATDYVPRTGPPVSTKYDYATIFMTLHPIQQLTIDNTYLGNRYLDRATGRAVFNNHILRSKWNYQFTRELSLRFITQYTAVLPNLDLTSLKNSKNVNADVLVTWLLHPGTAVYVGYNSNLQNLGQPLGVDPDGDLLRTRSKFLNDGRSIFVKVSYLFRY